MTNKVKKGSELIVATSVSDQLAAVNKKLSSLQAIADTPYKTAGNLTGFSKNLREETDEATLIKMYSSVWEREKGYNLAAEALGFTKYPSFKVDGATADDWKADVLLRISIVRQKATYDKLMKIKNAITELMDKDDKLALLTAELQTVEL